MNIALNERQPIQKPNRDGQINPNDIDTNSSIGIDWLTSTIRLILSLKDSM